jgi:hypothetical protein
MFEALPAHFIIVAWLVGFSVQVNFNQVKESFVSEFG